MAAEAPGLVQCGLHSPETSPAPCPPVDIVSEVTPSPFCGCCRLHHSSYSSADQGTFSQHFWNFFYLVSSDGFLAGALASKWIDYVNQRFCLCARAGVDNWSRLHTKLVSLCPDFTKDSEACRKKWAAIYNEYKEDKVMNAKSGSNRSEKCRWFSLVEEFMFDRANVISHAHSSAVNPDGPRCVANSETNTLDQRSGESTSKSPEPKRKEEIFLERCFGKIDESGDRIMNAMKSCEEMKMALLVSMQQTMAKLVDKL